MKNIKRIFSVLLLLAVVATAAAAAPQTVTLVLLRHGESEWNLEKRFTGWSDVKLTRKGVQQAFAAGKAMKDAGLTFDAAHTSLLDRAIATTWLALSAMDLRWLPVLKTWRLNERCYGDLEGKTHDEVIAAVGPEQTEIWRRSYGTPPPALAYDDPRSPINDPAYFDIDPRMIPQAESLKDVIARVGPYWSDVLRPALYRGDNVLVVGHSTGLRALCAWIEPELDEDALTKLEIPNAVPILYTFEFDGPNCKVVKRETLTVPKLPDPEKKPAGKPAEKPAAKKK